MTEHMLILPIESGFMSMCNKFCQERTERLLTPQKTKVRQFLREKNLRFQVEQFLYECGRRRADASLSPHVDDESFIGFLP